MLLAPMAVGLLMSHASMLIASGVMDVASVSSRLSHHLKISDGSRPSTSIGRFCRTAGTLLCWTLASLPLEIHLLKRVHGASPALQTHCPQPGAGDGQSERGIVGEGGAAGSWLQPWRVFCAQKARRGRGVPCPKSLARLRFVSEEHLLRLRRQVFAPAVSLSLLHLTVLSFGFLMTSYVRWVGLPPDEISVYRGFGARLCLSIRRTHCRSALGSVCAVPVTASCCLLLTDHSMCRRRGGLHGNAGLSAAAPPRRPVADGLRGDRVSAGLAHCRGGAPSGVRAGWSALRWAARPACWRGALPDGAVGV